MPEVPHVLGRGRSGADLGATGAGGRTREHESLRGARGAGYPEPAAAQWVEPASTGSAHGRSAHLRFEDREREGNPDAVVIGAARQRPYGVRAGIAYGMHASATERDR